MCDAIKNLVLKFFKGCRRELRCGGRKTLRVFPPCASALLCEHGRIIWSSFLLCFERLLHVQLSVTLSFTKKKNTEEKILVCRRPGLSTVASDRFILRRRVTESK